MIPAGAINEVKIKYTRLRDNFVDGPPLDAVDHVVRHYVRAYMLALVRSVLFPDKFGTDIRLFVLPLLRDLVGVGIISWDFVVLACLYHCTYGISESTTHGLKGPSNVIS